MRFKTIIVSVIIFLGGMPHLQADPLDQVSQQAFLERISAALHVHSEFVYEVQELLEGETGRRYQTLFLWISDRGEQRYSSGELGDRVSSLELGEFVVQVFQREYWLRRDRLDSPPGEFTEVADIRTRFVWDPACERFEAVVTVPQDLFGREVVYTFRIEPGVPSVSYLDNLGHRLQVTNCDIGGLNVREASVPRGSLMETARGLLRTGHPSAEVYGAELTLQAREMAELYVRAIEAGRNIDPSRSVTVEEAMREAIRFQEWSEAKTGVFLRSRRFVDALWELAGDRLTIDEVARVVRIRLQQLARRR